jgi:hypothetical protein
MDMPYSVWAVLCTYSFDRHTIGNTQWTSILGDRYILTNADKAESDDGSTDGLEHTCS